MTSTDIIAQECLSKALDLQHDVPSGIPQRGPLKPRKKVARKNDGRAWKMPALPQGLWQPNLGMLILAGKPDTEFEYENQIWKRRLYDGLQGGKSTGDHGTVHLVEHDGSGHLGEYLKRRKVLWLWLVSHERIIGFYTENQLFVGRPIGELMQKIGFPSALLRRVRPAIRPVPTDQ